MSQDTQPLIKANPSKGKKRKAERDLEDEIAANEVSAAQTMKDLPTYNVMELVTFLQEDFDALTEEQQADKWVVDKFNGAYNALVSYDWYKSRPSKKERENFGGFQKFSGRR